MLPEKKNQARKEDSKHLIIWADQDSLVSGFQRGIAGQDSEIIEVQSPVLAEQFLQAHRVSILVASSKFGLSFWQRISNTPNLPIVILLLEESDVLALPQFINSLPGLFILRKPLSLANVTDALSRALLEANTLQAKRNLQRESARQYRELESLNAGLEKTVEDRTRHIESAKIEEEEKLSKVRNLIRFIKDLSSASAHEEFLEVLRRETRKFGKLGDPILLLGSGGDDMTLFAYQSGHFVRTESKLKLEGFGQIQLKDATVQKFLANHFGRPFGKIFVLSLDVQSGSPTSGHVYLCLENFMTESESHRVFEFLLERLEPMSITVDRLLLEQEHSENAFRWERTFDSLARPIAIIDVAYDVLRSNRNFLDRQSGKICYEDFAGRSSPCDGCPLGEALEKGKPAHGTVQMNRPGGNKIYQVHSYPINLEGGRATNVVNVYVDITQSRELYIRLLQSEKMGALGVLAGNIAHELNNPLTGIRSLTQVLLHEMDAATPLAGDLREIEKATERSQRIIKNLQDFSSKEGPEQTEFSLDELVERTMPMLKTLLRTHRLELNLDSEPARVKGEPHLIQQVIFNLINNACQSMKSPGTLSISTEIVAEDQKILLRIKDTGGGIPEEFAARIFDPFFTTKREGQGTGLGLSLSKEIVERHQGQIDFVSSAEAGTEFFVRFPRMNP